MLKRGAGMRSTSMARAVLSVSASVCRCLRGAISRGCEFPGRPGDSRGAVLARGVPGLADWADFIARARELPTAGGGRELSNWIELFYKYQRCGPSGTAARICFLALEARQASAARPAVSPLVPVMAVADTAPTPSLKLTPRVADGTRSPAMALGRRCLAMVDWPVASPTLKASTSTWSCLFSCRTKTGPQRDQHATIIRNSQEILRPVRISDCGALSPPCPGVTRPLCRQDRMPPRILMNSNGPSQKNGRRDKRPAAKVVRGGNTKNLTRNHVTGKY